MAYSMLVGRTDHRWMLSFLLILIEKSKSESKQTVCVLYLSVYTVVLLTAFYFHSHVVPSTLPKKHNNYVTIFIGIRIIDMGIFFIFLIKLNQIPSEINSRPGKTKLSIINTN
jgi:uncharacterized membrane protein